MPKTLADFSVRSWIKHNNGSFPVQSVYSTQLLFLLYPSQSLENGSLIHKKLITFKIIIIYIIIIIIIIIIMMLMMIIITVITTTRTKITAKYNCTQWKEGNVLFNDALNTFYLRLYGVRHMVKVHSDSERGNLLLPHTLLFPISSKGSFICIIPQTGYHIPRPLLHQSWSVGWNEK